jgi:hypothetical protein
LLDMNGSVFCNVVRNIVITTQYKAPARSPSA